MGKPFLETLSLFACLNNYISPEYTITQPQAWCSTNLSETKFPLSLSTTTDVHYALKGLDPDDPSTAVECSLVNLQDISIERNDPTSLKRNGTIRKRFLTCRTCKFMQITGSCS